MSDCEFVGFNVDTIAEAVRQPPLDDLRSAARSRRRRRNGGMGVAIVVLAGMAVLSWPPARAAWTGTTRLRFRRHATAPPSSS